MDAVAAGFGLTGTQIVNRATAMSCAGCHLPNGFGLTNANAIGPGMSWPSALAFVHVDTLPMVSLAGQPDFDPAQFGGNSQGFNISPALLNTFLPARRNTLVNLANQDVCDCVRKPGPLPLGSVNKKLGSELAAVRRDFARKEAVKPNDLRQLLAKQRSVIAKAETARNAELERAGITFAEPPLKPEPVILSRERLPADKLQKLKAENVNQAVKAEPPRQTITGSFRSH